ncbi:MAG: AMP-binding protein [Gammaproteobacteria bacterium]|nr:AMP-binding protein [Gammaproteobacteria bacterium]
MTAQRLASSLIERLFYYAEKNPTHDAVVTSRLTLSYAQLAQLVRIQVKKYNDMAISADSVLGIKCADDTQHLVLCLGAIHIGATSCTIPTHEANLTQNAIISRCGVSHVVDENIAVDPMSMNINVVGCNAESIPEEAHAIEARLLFSTSGTTGDSKLVIHHDNDLVIQAHRHIGCEQERFACLASMQHNFAKRHRLYCVAAGATNVFLDAEQQQLVAQCLHLKVNVIHVSAFQAQELLATPDIGMLSEIRLKLGGSHVSLPLRHQLRNNITNNLQAGYGTTETGAIAFTDPKDSNAGESVGQPLPGIEIRAVTPERKPLAVGERGELAIRCDGMFRGYLGKSSLTTTCLEDGWFYTGDIGYLDKQRRIHLCGRSDDMFVFNSMNIFPQDIESQICQYPHVTDAAVLPKTSSVHGSIPVALVVFVKGVKPDLRALKKFVRGRVGIRSPRQFTIVENIPRNASGKILRCDVMNMSNESEQIRSSIVQVLADVFVTNKLNPSVISAFEKGDKDITLREIGMDSLARMELLVMLEMDHDAVIMPHEFARFRSLDNIVSRVLTPSSKDELEQGFSAVVNDTSAIVTETNKQPYVVRFFKRIFRYCLTVAQLNKALTTLESRLTPIEVECLIVWHPVHRLIPSSTAVKFQTALNHWLQKMKRMMSGSGKQQSKPFTWHKIAPHVTHFVGPGLSANKTLLVCFSPLGSHNLMMPNAVLMQHTDSVYYDLLIISEPLNEGYRQGVPLLGNNVTEVVESLAKLDLMGDYCHIRTLGSSAGCYPAVIAGYLLGAEMSVSIGGRFPSERHPLRFFKMVFTIWRAKRKGRCSRVLMSYATDSTRDRNYTRVMVRLCGSSALGVECTDEKVGHLIFERLVERGELALYLARTIFANTNDALIATERIHVIMNLSTTQIRPYDSPMNS